MALQFLRVQNLMYFRSNHHVHPAENSESKLTTISVLENQGSESVEGNEESGSISTSRKCAVCPVCILPAVVAFIFIFTIVQLIIIHHTIENYKLREQAYQDCYYPHGHPSGSHPRHEEYAQQLDMEHNHAHGHRAAAQTFDTTSPLKRESGGGVVDLPQLAPTGALAAGFSRDSDDDEGGESDSVTV